MFLRIKLFQTVLMASLAVIVFADQNPCRNLPNGTGFVNNPAACPYYFSCVSFTPFEVSCPAGFYYDEVPQVCDLAHLVNCRRCPADGVHALEDRTSCERWILCVYGHELPQKCAPGTAFNPALGTCDLAQNVRCALDTCLHVEGGIGLAPAPDNCYDYFYCFNNEKLFRGHCSPGLAFDSITRGCVRRGQETCFAVGASVPRANVPRAQVAIRQ